MTPQKRKPRRANVEAFSTENTLTKEFPMKTVREPSKKVKRANEPTLFGAKLSEMSAGDLEEIRVVCLRAIARSVCRDLRTATKGPAGRPAFRVIEGGRCA